MPPPLITIAEARRLVAREIVTLPPETVPIDSAIGRVLAADVAAAADVPPFPSSAMDGYALSPGAAGRMLAVVGESRAGTPFDRQLGDGEAVRISTGAAVPSGTAAVIRQEDTTTDGSTVSTMADVTEGQNVRKAGEDMRAGAVVLRAGTVLGAVELGAAVAAGAAALEVHTKPRVTVLSTGDELRAPGEPLGPGEIHNSNAPMLAALASRSGALTEGDVRLPDDRALTEAALGDAIARSDVVVVSGGVSVGPHDHVKPALAALGVREVFWGVALQPGKPTWFGTAGGPLVFGLPGNPVSSAVTFSLFVRPALLALQGATGRAPHPRAARLAEPIRRNPEREQALRVRLEQRGHETFATPTGPQGSNIVTSLLDADALAMIPAGEGPLEAGTWVELEEMPR